MTTAIHKHSEFYTGVSVQDLAIRAHAIFERFQFQYGWPEEIVDGQKFFGNDHVPSVAELAETIESCIAAMSANPEIKSSGTGRFQVTRSPRNELFDIAISIGHVNNVSH